MILPLASKFSILLGNQEVKITSILRGTYFQIVFLSIGVRSILNILRTLGT